MDKIHRYNTKERQHYLLGSHYFFRLKAQLLYVGTLTKRPGWGDEPHSHEFAEVLLVTDGCGTVTADDVELSARKGDIIVYNAGVLHAEKSSVEEPLELLFFALDKISITDLEPNCLLPPEYECVIHSEEQYEVFKAQLDTMVSEMENKERFYQEIAQYQARMFLLYLFRLLNKNTQETILKKNRSFAEALEYVDAHYLEPITLETVADACYLNKYYLSHLFSKEQNMSVGQYIIKRRVDEARHLLENGNQSVSSVAELAGFNDFSYFCRAFKRLTGMTPMQYRRRAQK